MSAVLVIGAAVSAATGLFVLWDVACQKVVERQEPGLVEILDELRGRSLTYEPGEHADRPSGPQRWR